jgi:hypothetical protein
MTTAGLGYGISNGGEGCKERTMDCTDRKN